MFSRKNSEAGITIFLLKQVSMFNEKYIHKPYQFAYFVYSEGNVSFVLAAFSTDNSR